MAKVLKGSTFLSKDFSGEGSVAVLLNKKELEVTWHALIAEFARIAQSYGTHYGSMTREELKAYIAEFQEIIKETEKQ